MGEPQKRALPDVRAQANVERLADQHVQWSASCVYFIPAWTIAGIKDLDFSDPADLRPRNVAPAMYVSDNFALSAVTRYVWRGCLHWRR